MQSAGGREAEQENGAPHLACLRPGGQLREEEWKMNQDILVLRKALREGRCCSTALVSLAMQKKGMDYGEAAEAVSVLCRGMHAGMTCGALTGGALALGILAPGAAADAMASELAAWFQEFYGEFYGGTDCAAILAGDPDNEMLRCPRIVENVWDRILELLEDEGLDPDMMKEENG